MFVPAHRPPPNYQAVGQIPTSPTSLAQHAAAFQQAMILGVRSVNNNATRLQNATYVLKEALISLGLFAYGNQIVKGNPEYAALFERFQEVLRKLLPKEIGFKSLAIEMPEIVLQTYSGEFLLESMSGGINSLFLLAWQVLIAAIGKQAVTVTIDEPENHLHPSMQRSLIPGLVDAFPMCKFIVVTHSPFIVTSSKSARVYALTFNEDREALVSSPELESNKFVTSNLLDAVALSGTPNQILGDVLGLNSVLPVWVEKEINEFIASTRELNETTRGTQFLEFLNRLGLSELPKQI
jgi:hypothetical protein